MQLWTDYEGVTLDGAFPLKKLLMPEGRSAFFATAGPSGEPTVVRLIECHFDEAEILARWRSVQALHHPNFLKFQRFAQTELDGRPVVYAVFEKVDANLAEVLDQGRLSLDDVAQLAFSLVAALDVLHTHGFIHEHLEPRNIFALGDVVKLRGDCIREAPEGEEGHSAKQRDVRNLATVLLQALTQRQSLEGLPDSALPPPFGQIIRKAIDGTWGLQDIRAALERQFGSYPPAAPNPTPPPPATPRAPLPKAPSTATKPPQRQPSTPPAPQPLLKQNPNPGLSSATTRSDTWSPQVYEEDAQSFSLRSRWIGAGIGALLLLLCAWALTHALKSHRQSPPQGAATSQPAGQSAGQPAVQPRRQLATSPTPPPASLPTAAASRAGWRVIVYTYDRRPDAEKKVADLARTHPGLQPEVFTPSGHAPYLVSIGGVMDRDAAYALAHRSRSLRLPHDMYAQNYSR